MIRTLIVDDEPLARERIGSLLGEHSDFLIVGEADHGEQAIDRIRALQPDIVFLDVQMPGLSGFDVIEAVGPAAMPFTIFVTAFDTYAVRAFEVEALDYVLKPFDDIRFGRLLERVRRTRHLGGHEERLGGLMRAGVEPRLVARSATRRRVIDWDDIEWIRAAGNYAEVHGGSQIALIDSSLTALATRLPAGSFARIHRSTIVRLGSIVELRLEAHGDGVVTMASGVELRVSRRYRADIDMFLAAR